MPKLTERDRDAVEAFSNFLSWEKRPYRASDGEVMHAYRAVPPAWWANVLGATRWCPPKGEM